MQIKTISYDIQPLITKGISNAALKNTTVDFKGAFDNIIHFQEFVKKTPKIDLIIIGLLSSDGCCDSMIHKIRDKYKDVVIIAYSVIESKFIIDSLMSGGVNKVINKRIGESQMLELSIQEYFTSSKHSQQ